MLFAEASARFWLVLHAVLGASLVAVTTHLVIWTRKWPRGDIARIDGARWLASVGLGLYLAQFLVGNVLYPAYKVRVRTEYFDLGSAVQDDGAARQKARDLADDRRRADAYHDGRDPGGPAPPVAMPETRNLTHVSRVFDVKEHWAALGVPLSAGACAMALFWRPKRDGLAGAKLLVACAVGAALCAWIAAIIGLVVTSYRSVGDLA